MYCKSTKKTESSRENCDLFTKTMKIIAHIELISYFCKVTKKLKIEIKG